MDAARVAQDLIAQAEHDENAAFNLQHALAREGDRAANQILADGAKRKQAIAQEQARRARADADAARFTPEDDSEVPPPVGSTGSAAGARLQTQDDAPAAGEQARTAATQPTRPASTDDAREDDEPPAHWLS